MKTLKLIILTIAIGSLLIVSSCKKSFYTDANVNTNAPNSSSVLPSAILSTVEAALAYTQGGDLERFVSMLTQQTNGVSRQSAAYMSYTFTGQDFDDLWGNLYTSTMGNCNNLMQRADAKGYNEYSGIARLLMAYTLQLTVDTWGSVPFSQAFMGTANLNPGYDGDQALYAAITKLIDDGIVFLNNSDPGNLNPAQSGEDVIYGGDASKWIKFGHAVKARIYMHQSKGNATMAANALTEIAASFSSNGDNAQYLWGTTQTSANPWNQFNNQRGDISFSTSTLATMLSSLNDPRYSIYIDSANDPSGLGLGAYYGSINSPVELISYDELLFMTAEATLTSNGSVANADSAYLNGIRANMDKLGVSSASRDAYVAARGPITSGQAGIDSVAAQEYLALYLNPEEWATWRRTNFPVLTPMGGTNGVPRRLIYPQSEYSYNGTNTPAATLWSPKLFWDN